MVEVPAIEVEEDALPWDPMLVPVGDDPLDWVDTWGTELGAEGTMEWTTGVEAAPTGVEMAPD